MVCCPKIWVIKCISFLLSKILPNYGKFYVKIQCSEFRKWHFRGLNFRNFLGRGGMPSQVCDGLEWATVKVRGWYSSTFTFMISNENGWRHHSPSITMQLTSGCRPCWQKRRLLKLSIICLIVSGTYESNIISN